MNESEIANRQQELELLFAGIPDDVLMRFANRGTLVCRDFDRKIILNTLAADPEADRRELKVFLKNSVSRLLRQIDKLPSGRITYYVSSSGMRWQEEYKKYISCEGKCVFDPPLPYHDPHWPNEYKANLHELTNRDHKLLETLRQQEEVMISRNLLKQEEFNTSCADSETARAEATLRDGIVKSKMAELERYVKEQMTLLRKENQLYLENMRNEFLKDVVTLTIERKTT